MPINRRRSRSATSPHELGVNITPGSAGLYLGSLQDAENVARSNPLKISTVLTLCGETVERRTPEVIYLHFPISDTRPIARPQLFKILKAIEQSIADGPVLLHCAAGLSRTPTIAAAYLHHVGWRSFPEALAYLAEIRPEIGPSPVLVHSVFRHLKGVADGCR